MLYSYYKPFEDNNAHRAWPIWTQGAWLAGSIKGITKHCCTQNIIALGLMAPMGVANLDPRGMIGRIYVGYH